MVEAVHVWFVVETSSMTHDFAVNGTSLPIFAHTTERNIQRRTNHRAGIAW
ncbi:hypothetical protein [Brevibacillus panacihumi]|uniref:hypothetical protein n=1 Tax=Brevibacillus panacihumi TaxID=497735 RepID=UPI003D1BCB05